MMMRNQQQELRRDMVDMAVKFLVRVGVHSGRPEEVPSAQIVQFLKDNGLTDAEIREAQRVVSFERSVRACVCDCACVRSYGFVPLVMNKPD